MRKLFGDRNFYRRVLMVAIPIMVQNGITNFVSMLDNIMVGQIGTEQTGTGQTGTAQTGAGQTGTGQTYILNTNTKKFHVPECSSVSQIRDGNRREVTSTRDELTEAGYAPCKQCNP